MKWIGQHIWDFISRFRSDIYLEGTETGTIASGGNLGLDSNNKVVKSASPSGTIDLTSEVTGTLPVGSGGTGATTLTDNSILTGTGTSPITAESSAWITTSIGTNLGITSSLPQISLYNSGDDAVGGFLSLYNTRGGTVGAADSALTNDDQLGKILFKGGDSGGADTIFAEMIGTAKNVTHTDEAGLLQLVVATSNGISTTRQQGLTATGAATANTVDVGLGYGASSTTTIAGNATITSGLTMGSTAAMTSAGLLSVGNQSNITGLGTISSGTWEGTDIGVAHGGTGLSTVGANEILTGNGTGALTSESTLTYSGSSLNLGDADNSSGVGVVRTPGATDTDGGNLSLTGGFARVGTANNRTGGDILVNVGGGTGTGLWGSVKIRGGVATVSGTGQLGAVDNVVFAKTDVANSITQYEPTSTDDYFSISTRTNGAAVVTTHDDSGNNGATLDFNTDGGISFSPANAMINKIYDFQATEFENNYDADKASGTILRYSPGADESPAGSELFYLHTDGTWNQTDADDVATGASQLLGVGLGASARTTGVLLKGFVRIASTEILNVPTGGDAGEVDGLPVYVSTTPGHFDFTAPSGTSDFVRIVGYAIDDNGGDVLIYFDPDKTWVEIA
jgi:hypothetical protein